MFGSLRFAFRHIRSNKFMSSVSILGLSVGLAAFILVSLYVRQELTCDSFHENSDRIVRHAMHLYMANDQTFFGPYTSPSTGPDIAREIAGVDDFLRLTIYASDLTISFEDKAYSEAGIFWADSSFFDFFSFELLSGDPETALNLKNSTVITEATAKKYFGDIDPVGKEIFLNYDSPYTVTGIMKDWDRISHLPEPPMICSWTSFGIVDDGNWLSGMNYHTYYKLADGAKIAEVEADIAVLNTLRNADILESIGAEFDIFLQPLREIRLYSNLDYDAVQTNTIVYVYQFAAIGFFILLIACLNFINLSTATSSKRSRQVGISKTLGATRRSLVRQFLTESTLFALFAMVIACGIVYLFLPVFQNLIDSEISFASFDIWKVLASAAGLTLIIGLLAGSYPAFFLSSFEPVKVLKGQLYRGKSGSKLRSTLVVIQFSVTIILIAGTLIISKQMNFIRKTNLGFNKDQILVVPLQTVDSNEKFEIIKNEISNIAGVLTSTSGDDMPSTSSDNSSFHIPGRPPEDRLLIHTKRIGYDYLEKLGFTLLDGRNFDQEHATDSDEAIIINQTLADALGYETIIGGTVEEPIPSEGDPAYNTLNIIGVVEDFHFESFHHEIRPVIFRINQGNPGRLFFQLDSENVQQTMIEIEKAWDKIMPSQPIQFSFLDDEFEQNYRAELRMAAFFKYLTILAIFIATIGLFALSTFAAGQRTKEIGIRKVLGATSGEMVVLLTRSFVTLVLISNVIAIPVTWYLMDRWLDGFIYKANVGVGTFLIVTAISLSIALITVSLQATKASLMNPVKSLRSE